MEYFRDAATVLDRLAEDPPEEIRQLVDDMFNVWDRGGTVVSFGNGGSASDSIHFTTELVAKMYDEPIQKPALSLNTNPSSLTAISNDWSFDEVFKKQVEAIVKPVDLVIGISTSGNSRNVNMGLRAAREIGAFCYGMTGRSGGKMTTLNVSLIKMPSDETPHIQQAHVSCLHWVCHEVDRRLNET